MGNLPEPNPHLLYKNTEVVRGEVIYEMTAKSIYDDIVVIRQKWSDSGKSQHVSLCIEELEAILVRAKKHVKKHTSSD